MDVDGRAHTCWARTSVLCEARARGGCDAMQTDLFLEPDTLSTNLFLSLFLSSLPKSFSFFLSRRSWTGARLARAYCQARAGRASVLCEAHPARVWCEARAARPARARHTMRPAPIVGPETISTSLWYIMTLVDGRAPGARSV